MHDGAEVAAVSGALSDRARLRADLERIEAEVFLVEIKAAAIDVVAEEAVRRGVDIVFVDNEVRALPGVREANVELVFDPPWELSMMPESARLALGMY